MNGYATIKVNVEGGEPIEHTLYFGRQAVEEFGTRFAKHMTANSFKVAVDMVYAGLANQSTKLDLPPIPYLEVYDMMERFSDQPDYEEQYAEVSRIFWESKHGRDYNQKLEEVKKKVTKEIEDLKVKAAIAVLPTEKQETTGTT